MSYILQLDSSGCPSKAPEWTSDDHRIDARRDVIRWASAVHEWVSKNQGERYDSPLNELDGYDPAQRPAIERVWHWQFEEKYNKRAGFYDSLYFQLLQWFVDPMKRFKLLPRAGRRMIGPFSDPQLNCILRSKGGFRFIAEIRRPVKESRKAEREKERSEKALVLASRVAAKTIRQVQGEQSQGEAVESLETAIVLLRKGFDFMGRVVADYCGPDTGETRGFYDLPESVENWFNWLQGERQKREEQERAERARARLAATISPEMESRAMAIYTASAGLLSYDAAMQIVKNSVNS